MGHFCSEQERHPLAVSLPGESGSLTLVSMSRDDLTNDMTFRVEEVSANVYCLRGQGPDGSTIELTGPDPDALREEARHWLEQRRST